MRNQKAQTEILGLVIVVIMLSVGIIFVVYTISHSKPSTIKKEYQNIEIAQNFLLAINNVNVKNCNNIQMQRLFTHCFPYDKLGLCNQSDPSISSCGVINKTIKRILNQTLDKWSVRYYLFYNQTNSGTHAMIFKNNCNPDDPKEEYLKPGKVYLTEGRTGTLIICK